MCHSPREGMMASHDSNGSDRHIGGVSNPHPQRARPNSMRSSRVSGQPARKELHVPGHMIPPVALSQFATGIRAQRRAEPMHGD